MEMNIFALSASCSSSASAHGSLIIYQPGAGLINAHPCHLTAGCPKHHEWGQSWLRFSNTLLDADIAYVQSEDSFKAVIASLLTSDSFLCRK
jgi:hypothetical protein